MIGANGSSSRSRSGRTSSTSVAFCDTLDGMVDIEKLLRATARRSHASAWESPALAFGTPVAPPQRASRGRWTLYPAATPSGCDFCRTRRGPRDREGTLGGDIPRDDAHGFQGIMARD